jgi:acetyl-CoA synthetase
VLGSVGEPINPEAWAWYHRVVGDGRCPIVDTWWQTETGGILITPLPGAIAQKPGSATKPFFGVQARDRRQRRARARGPGEGNLVLTDSWPGQMRTVFGDHQRFIDTYFQDIPGRYFTGDGARPRRGRLLLDHGRVDDVLNVAGHRLGTAEIRERAGRRTPPSPRRPSSDARTTSRARASMLRDTGRAMRSRRTSFAGTPRMGAQGNRPDRNAGSHPVGARVPKTRSGKIMRRASCARSPANEVTQLGDCVDAGRSVGRRAAVVRGLTETQRDELREAFFFVDGNRDGEIVFAEFAKLLTSLRSRRDGAQCHDGIPMPSTPTRDGVDRVR